MPKLDTTRMTWSCSPSVTLLSTGNTYYVGSGHKFRVQTDHSALQHILDQPRLIGRQMRLLETLQEYDFNIEYYPDARNYIQDALRLRSDHKTPPIPRVSSTSPRRRPPVPAQPTALNGTYNHSTDRTPSCTAISTGPLHTSGVQAISIELLLASGIQANEWMAQLRQEYKTCPYFAGVLTAPGGQDPPADDTEMLRQLRAMRARQFPLEEDGLICQRAAGRTGVPTSPRPLVLSEVHDSSVGGYFGA